MGLVKDLGKKTVYQVYPKSFQDTTGDGFGDLRGIIKRLDYIAALGVDLIWITPFFPSPQRDGGYDISDYRSIDPRYGTMEDLDDLIAEARKRGLGIMLDMVLNHTSIEHEWFQRALAGEERYRGYYHFVEGDPEHLPNDWQSIFGGPAWEWSDEVGAWYLHLFDVSQADLNWENPELRKEAADILRFWKDKGIAGFRFDVVNLISKPEGFESMPADAEGIGCIDGPHIHEYLRELVREGGIEGMVTVGEMFCSGIDSCAAYSNPSQDELSMIFSSDHLTVDFADGKKWRLMPADLGKLHELLRSWQEGMQALGGWNATFWSNHDQPRVASKFGDPIGYWKQSAKAFALLSLLMRGTPYIYQGEEIGMTNANFDSIDDYQDVEAKSFRLILLEEGKTEDEVLHVLGERARDNSRTPMQWSPCAGRGFTDAVPWSSFAKDAPGFKQDDATVEVEEGDPASILHFYRKLVGLRKTIPAISDGAIKFIDLVSAPLFSFCRFGNLPDGDALDAAAVDFERLAEPGSLLVAVNITDSATELGPEVQALLKRGGWKLLASTYEDAAQGEEGPSALCDRLLGSGLRPFEGVAFLKE